MRAITHAKGKIFDWWVISAGWRPLTPQEAYDCELEQSGRWSWDLFEISFFGGLCGFGLSARCVPHEF